MNREALQAWGRPTVHGVTELDTTERLSTNKHTHTRVRTHTHIYVPLDLHFR